MRRMSVIRYITYLLKSKHRSVCAKPSHRRTDGHIHRSRRAIHNYAVQPRVKEGAVLDDTWGLTLPFVFYPHWNIL